MISNILIKNFFEGKIQLWKSFWLVGISHSIALFLFIPMFDKILFSNSEIYTYIEIEQNSIQLPNFIKLSLFSKLITILSTCFVTIGIWRATENYEGALFWIILSFLYLVFNNILPTIYLTLSIFI